MRAKGEVRLLLASYKDTNKYLQAPAYSKFSYGAQYMGFFIKLMIVRNWSFAKTIASPFACPSFPASVEKQWFERGKLKGLVSTS